MSIAGGNFAAPIAASREQRRVDAGSKARRTDGSDRARRTSRDEFETVVDVDETEAARRVPGEGSEEGHEDRLKHGQYGADGRPMHGADGAHVDLRG